MSLIRSTTYEAAVIRGIAYVFANFFSLNNGGILEITITAPASHPLTIGLTAEISSDAKLQIDVFRGATLNATPGGTILALQNANEASSNTADTILREGPTIDADGTFYAGQMINSGTRGKGGVGAAGNTVNLATALGTTLIRLTSGSSQNSINLVIRVIEEES